MMNNKIHIGTSGWQYKEWKGQFYPESINNEKMLEKYHESFSTVEVNNSFYQLPAEDTLNNWSEQTDDDFIFAMKANRYITHMKKLNEPQEALEKMFDRFDVIDPKIGVILFQLPPNWNSDPDRLKKFCDLLSEKYRYSFEFRNDTWYNDDIYEILNTYNCALCINDIDGKLSPMKFTTDFTYIRLHGPNERYKGSYSNEQLSNWKENIENSLKETNEIFCFFNNDTNAHAPHNAEKLKNLFG